MRAKIVGRAADPGSGPSYIERLAIKHAGSVLFLTVNQIDWIEAADYYVSLHVGMEAYQVREPLKSLEVSLDPTRFFRIHRSTIVNLDRVRELRPYQHGDYVAVMMDGTELRISRSRRKTLQEQLDSKRKSDSDLAR